MMKSNALKKLLPLAIAILTLFPHCTKKPPAKPHILLITVDTLRRDHLGFYGWARNTSPFIDQLAKNGTVFKNTITPLPLTDGSHASILTSLHPLVHGVRNNATRLMDNVETIAEALKKNGYHTIGAVSVYHLGSGYNYSQGFDSFSDQWDKNKKHNLEWQRIAKYTNQSLFQQIDDYKKNHNNKPLFIWVHYYDPHVPYINWEHIQFKPQTRMKYKGTERYDKDIRYTDDAIKTLHNYLEQKELTKKLVT
ncbi:MAG: sulfatase, partial [bacterium]|nr:sulfatase [bacterium]